MTNEDIKKLQHYAYKIYNASGIGYIFKYDTLEDVEQNVILLALENGKNSNFGLCSKIMAKYTMASDKKEYVRPKLFSEIIYDNKCFDDNDFIDTFLPSVTDEYFQDSRDKYIGLAKLIFPKKPERQQTFLDFINGASVGASVARDLRIVIFYHRIEILKYLYLKKIITKREFNQYKQIMNSITTRPKAAKKLKQSSSAIACRKSYNSNIENSRAKVLEKYYKRKANKNRVKSVSTAQVLSN